MTNVIVKFFETIGHALKKVFGSTTWETQAIATISYAEPIVIGILGFVDPLAVPLVTGILTAIVSSLNTVKSIVQQGTVPAGSPAALKVTTELNSVKDNLSALLADAHIKNSEKIAQITAAVGIVNGEVDAILGQAPAVSA
jgi:hypothetical protein